MSPGHAIYLSFALAKQELRGRYRRSIIGPFWLTISMGVLIASIGFVFGQIFRTPMDVYLPFLAVGLILWTFISGTITESCMGFIESEGIIKQLPIPLFVHILRVLWRNILILAHNILILPALLLLMGKDLSILAIWAIPGVLLALLCLSWVALLVAMLCARYRDLPQVVASILLVAFYFTPIVWMPLSLPTRADAVFLYFNPFYHLLEIIRSPLLGVMPSLTSWLVVAVITFLGWLVALFLFSRLHKRLAYWL